MKNILTLLLLSVSITTYSQPGGKLPNIVDSKIYLADGTPVLPLDTLPDFIIAGDGNLRYSDDAFSTLTITGAAKAGDQAVNRKTGAINYYNGSNWNTKSKLENGNDAITVLSDVATPFTFDATLNTRTYFQPSATAVDSVGAVANLSSANPGVIYKVCFENSTGSSDTITGWHNSYILEDGTQPADVVLAIGDYRCYEFTAETVSGSVKLVYHGTALGNVLASSTIGWSDLETAVQDSINDKSFAMPFMHSATLTDTVAVPSSSKEGVLIPAEYDGWEIIETSFRTKTNVATADLEVQCSRETSAGSSSNFGAATIVSGTRFDNTAGLALVVNTGDLITSSVIAAGSPVAVGLIVTIVLRKP